MQPDTTEAPASEPREPDAPSPSETGPSEPDLATERPRPPLPEGLADGRERSLDPRALTVSRIVGLIFAALMTGGTTVALAVLAWRFSPEGPAGWALLGVPYLLLVGLWFWLGWGWPAVRHRHISWWLDQRGMHIRRGVVWRVEESIPKSRVQHTDVSRGPIQRSFGVASLVIHTAGTHNASVGLSGLSYEDALAVRDHLIEGGEDDGV
mgnify:CR=1 FL=1